MTTINELPEKEKLYDVKLSDSHEFQVRGDVKEAILASQTQYVTLANGDMINKAFIVRMTLNKKDTIDMYNRKKRS